MCTLSQLVAKDKEAKKVLLGVNVDYSYSQDFPVLKIKLPKNTLTKNGVGVKIDDFASIQVPFSGCDEKSCQSIVKIDNELLKQIAVEQQRVEQLRQIVKKMNLEITNT